MKTTLALALFGAALITVPATAQTTRPADQAPAATQRAPAATQQNTEAKAPPLYEIKAGQWRATELDGLDVYNNNNEKIGDISELILDRTGKIEAVVIGVGGFLGLGEHLVAVPFNQVQWINEPRERQVSGTDRTAAGGGATGTGTSSAPAPGSSVTTTTSDRPGGTVAVAPPPGPAQVNAPLAGTRPDTPAGDAATTGTARTDTRVDPNTGATVTTTTPGNTTATGGARPAMTGTDRPAATGGERTGASGQAMNRDDANNRYRPDHAIVAMSKDQLKALPEVRYSR
jgi:sporulation protein YlmC with PRC-barrel domain